MNIKVFCPLCGRCVAIVKETELASKVLACPMCCCGFELNAAPSYAVVTVLHTSAKKGLL
jgi:hypothetical protein